MLSAGLSVDSRLAITSRTFPDYTYDQLNMLDDANIVTM